MIKVCIITCYNQPDYIRTRTLRSAASLIDGIEVITVKNSQTGLLRYGEVFVKALRARLRDKPDAYLLTFRGYEMLLPMRLLAFGKPLIYDEFINPIEWVVHERRQVEAKQTSSRVYTGLVKAVSRCIVLVVSSGIFRWAYKALVSSTDLVLSDTQSHADVSARLTGIHRSKIVDLPVGTDEAVFNEASGEKTGDETFTVFYYGNMLPLHGLDYVLKAAVQLAKEPVRFVFIGGNAQVANDIAVAVAAGAAINYKTWVEYDDLPKLMSAADLCLAGPFGDTFQAQYVVTGKAYQYLAMGRPTLVGANKESGIFTNKKDALVVPQADAAAIADTVRWAMNNRRELQNIGYAGRELYYREFSIAKIAEKLETALRGLGLELTTGTDSK